jgi:hypothetical protein
MISDSAKFKIGIASFIIIGSTSFLIAGVEAYTCFGIQKASVTWKTIRGVITKADISRVSIDNDYVVWRPEYKYELLYRYSAMMIEGAVDTQVWNLYIEHFLVPEL